MTGMESETMVRNVARLMLPLSLAVALAGCVNLGGKAPPSLLVLTPKQEVAGGTLRSGAAKDALVVLIPEVPRKLETTRVPVQIDSSNIAYVTNAVWADKPARLMQMLLMEIVAAKNGKLVLNEVDAGGKAADFLGGTLLEFGLDASRNEAVVIYDAVRLQNGKPVEKRRFEARSSVIAIEAKPAGAALNEAANTVANDIAVWLSGQV
jgi:cholesterol transport system auxiliary component